MSAEFANISNLKQSIIRIEFHLNSIQIERMTYLTTSFRIEVRSIKHNADVALVVVCQLINKRTILNSKDQIKKIMIKWR